MCSVHHSSGILHTQAEGIQLVLGKAPMAMVAPRIFSAGWAASSGQLDHFWGMTIVLEDSVVGEKGLDTQPALKELTY